MGSRIVGIVGAVLTIAGSFLPWERQGDFISYLTYGIQFFPKTSDHGGVMVVLLTAAILMLTFNPPRFVIKPRFWIFILASTLMLLSIFFLMRWLIHHIASTDIIGAASIEMGLIGVILGSVLLFLPAFINFRKSNVARKT